MIACCRNARERSKSARSSGLAAGSARLVGFWTSLEDAVANVTLESGTLILRQRKNPGAIRARGIEAEGEWRFGPAVSVVASAAVVDSIFTRSDKPGLTGRRVPQVPRWQTAASVRLTPGRAVVTVDWRAIGPQFDDDRNQFRLRRAFVTDAFAGARLRRWQPFVAIENVFDTEVDVGRTPVRTVGTPRTARVGVRVFF